MQALHTPRFLSATPSGTILIKLLTKSSWVGAHSFERHKFAVSHFGKVIKLFFSTLPQILSPEIPFNTSGQRLSVQYQYDVY